MKNNKVNETWPVFSQKEIDKVSKILRSGKVNYWTGQECKKFEKEFSDWTKSKFSIALSNGTVALDLCLLALDLKEEDEVIVSPRSFIASVSSVISVGAKPVFADIDIKTGNLSAETIETKITKRTKAIICVHLGGLPCEMKGIMSLAKKHDLYVIEDCAQAHGAAYKGKSVGTIGHFGSWSFCQDKIITTGGEGGMVTTNDKALWQKMWSLKDHGKDFDSVNASNPSSSYKWVHKSFGTNFRMTEMQGAIGREQLKKIKNWNKLRQRNASVIIDNLKNFPELISIYEIPTYINHAYYRVYATLNVKFLKKTWSRDRIIKEISDKGVPCFIGSCPEIYKEDAFKNANIELEKPLPNAKELGETCMAFLCHPTLTKRSLIVSNKIISEVLNSAHK